MPGVLLERPLSIRIGRVVPHPWARSLAGKREVGRASVFFFTSRAWREILPAAVWCHASLWVLAPPLGSAAPH